MNDGRLKFWGKINREPKNEDVIQTNGFSARNLTTNAGLFQMLEHARKNPKAYSGLLD